MAFTENLLEFLDDDDFAIWVQYQQSSVRVIFERQFLEQHGVQTSALTVLGRKSDFSAIAQGEAITIDDVVYSVQEFRHDPPQFPDWTLVLLGS
jgi:hypothetical protein